MRSWRGMGRLAIRHALLAALLGVLLGAAFSLLQVGDDYRNSVEAERREILQMMAVMREPAAQACYNPEPAGRPKWWCRARSRMCRCCRPRW